MEESLRWQERDAGRVGVVGSGGAANDLARCQGDFRSEYAVQRGTALSSHSSMK